MKTVYRNQAETLDVTAYGSTGQAVAAVLSSASATLAGTTLAVTITGQRLSVVIPADAPLGAATLAWAWTQVADGITSEQPASEAVIVSDAPTNGTFGQAAIDLVSSRLGPYKGAADLDPALIDSELTLSAARLRGRFRCIRDYSLLSASDQAAFDTAVALGAAITLLMSTAAGAGGGLSKLKADVFEYTFLVPSPEEQARWSDELTDAVSQISCIQNARVSQAQTINVFNVSGRTRERERTGRYALSRMVAALLPAGWGGDRPSYVVTPFVEIP